MSGLYEIVVFTAGVEEYACSILDKLDREKLIQHRLYRQHTRRIGAHIIKDLAMLNRPLARTVLMDNSAESYVLQPHNAIPITPYLGGTRDTTLLESLPLLQALSQAPDVRPVLAVCHAIANFISVPPSAGVADKQDASRRNKSARHDTQDCGQGAHDQAAHDETAAKEGVKAEGDVDVEAEEEVQAESEESRRRLNMPYHNRQAEGKEYAKEGEVGGVDVGRWCRGGRAAGCSPFLAAMSPSLLPHIQLLDEAVPAGGAALSEPGSGWSGSGSDGDCDKDCADSAASTSVCSSGAATPQHPECSKDHKTIAPPVVGAQVKVERRVVM